MEWILYVAILLTVLSQYRNCSVIGPFNVQKIEIKYICINTRGFLSVLIIPLIYLVKIILFWDYTIQLSANRK